MTVKENQNIIDVCLQNYGSLESLFDLANDNSLSLNADLVVGQELTIDDALVLEEKAEEIVAFYSQNRTVVVTGFGEIPSGSFNDDFNNDFDNL